MNDLAISPDSGLVFSSEMGSIAKALVLAQKEMGTVTKDKTAKVQTKTGGAYSYTYADLGSVLDAVLPALNNAGVCVVQGTEARYNGVAELRVTTMLLHESGQWARSVFAMRPNGSDPQSIGSAVTYARRYALLAMCGVAAEDDDGGKASATPQNGANHTPQPAVAHVPKVSSPPTISEEDAERFRVLAKEAGLDKETLIEEVTRLTGRRTNDYRKLTSWEAENLTRRFRKRIAEDAARALHEHDLVDEPAVQ